MSSMARASCAPDSSPVRSLVRSLSVIPALLAAMVLLVAPAMAQGPKDALFGEQRAALDAARAAFVDTLAPRAFGQALTAYQNAEKDFDRGRDAGRVNAQLATSRQALQAATSAATSARSMLATVLKTREDAVTADAARNAPEAWARASERFADAAARLERGDEQGAQKRAAEAEVLMRDAELLAIKGGLLGEARSLIAKADAAKIEDLAPRTLDEAKRLLAQADQEINRNRYDVAVPKDLAQQSAYQARHALYLAGLIGPLLERKKDEHALEELLLGMEPPLERLAAEMDLQARFDAGVQQPLEDMLKAAQARRQELARLKQEAEDREGQIVALNGEVKRLEDRLGGVSQERIALQRRVDAQARLRANLATVESTFPPEEARVSRTGDDIVISLLGINFPVGKSTIDASNEALMAKVRDSLALFSVVSIVVEGHTDSQGSDSANLILSQDRADAVKQYLVTSFGIDQEKITSIGYGETRPVASNDTADGRARNRRIDLVIRIDQAQAAQ
jgi:OmpA-OmpF porin, OOP family